MTLEADVQAKLVEVRSILELQHKVVFLPNSQLIVPSLDENYLEGIVGKEHMEGALRCLSYFRKYVCDCQPIMDKFNDHAERRKWRREMYEEFGDTFRIVYEEHNQLRINNMDFGGPISFLSLIAKKRKDNERHGRLVAIGTDLWSKVTGKDINTGKQIGESYREMTLGEKLEVVHFNEKGCLEILKMYYSRF